MMKKAPGRYTVVPIGFPTEPDLVAVSGPAMWFHVVATQLSAAQNTDGFIHRAALPLIAAQAKVSSKCHRELVACGRWVAADGGWQLADYKTWQLTREESAERTQNARRAAEARWNDASGNAERIPERSADGNAVKGSEWSEERAVEGSLSSHSTTRNGHGRPRARPLDAARSAPSAPPITDDEVRTCVALWNQHRAAGQPPVADTAPPSPERRATLAAFLCRLEGDTEAFGHAVRAFARSRFHSGDTGRPPCGLDTMLTTRVDQWIDAALTGKQQAERRRREDAEYERQLAELAPPPPPQSPAVRSPASPHEPVGPCPTCGGSGFHPPCRPAPAPFAVAG